MPARSASLSGRRRHSVERLISAALTSKYGFSVVAPMSTIDAGLDGRQQQVLLGLVEAVDLVDEQDGALAALAERARGARSIASRTSLHPRGDAPSSDSLA